MEFIRFNANNSDFVKKENVQSFFKSSNCCWNYLIEKFHNGFRLIRYYSNGWKNEDGMKTKFLIPLSEMPTSHDDCEILWHNC